MRRGSISNGALPRFQTVKRLKLWKELMHCRPRIACELLHLDDLDGARMVAEAEFQTCSRNEVSRIWASRLVLLEIERLHGNTVQALERLDYWQRVSPPDKDDMKSWTGVAKLRGYYLGLLGRYDSSHQLLQQAELMARAAGLLELRAEVYLCQAMIFYLQQNYSLSSAIFRAVLSLSGQIGGWYFKGSALWGIGKNLMIENHYHEAIPWLQDALAVFKSVGAKLSIALVWSELSVCYLGLGKDELALDLLLRANTVQSAAGTLANYQVSLANIGNVYLHRQDHVTAISYYRQALEIARQIHDPVSIRKWTYNIRLAYLRLRRTVDDHARKQAA